MKKREGVFAVTTLLCLAGCLTGRTRHIPAVTDFHVSRYLGTWYEIVRSDNRFERNLTHVTATYSRLDDNTIKVLNRGYNTRRMQWVQAEARAVFSGSSDRGELKVTFFRPFSAKYRVIELGDEYEYAVVTSHSLKYFWILSRDPVMDGNVVTEILNRAQEWGFATGSFIRVEQDPDSRPVLSSK